MGSHESPTKETIEAHNQDIDTLSEWAKEPLSDEDQAVFDQLADEAKRARAEDGTLTMAAEQLAERTRQITQEDDQAHADADWRRNPESRV